MDLRPTVTMSANSNIYSVICGGNAGFWGVYNGTTCRTASRLIFTLADELVKIDRRRPWAAAFGLSEGFEFAQL